MGAAPCRSVHQKFRNVAARTDHGADHFIGVDGAVDDVAGAAGEGFREGRLELLHISDAPPVEAIGLGEFYEVRAAV